MKHIRLRSSVLAGLAGILCCTTNRADTIVYTNNFESVVGPEWVPANTSVTPVGQRRFLGEFWMGNHSATLSLTNLPSHTRVKLSFDLFILKSWQGNEPGPFGPDLWELGFLGGAKLIYTSFSYPVAGGHPQAYPGSYPGASYPSAYGAAETNALGYDLGLGGDAVYRISINFDSTATDLALTFRDYLQEPISNESWGLDNVVVELQKVPVLQISKAVRLDFSHLEQGKTYQLQFSYDLLSWTNSGNPFTAAESTMSQYEDVDAWETFWRLSIVQ